MPSFYEKALCVKQKILGFYLPQFGPCQWRGVRSRKYKYARFQDKPWILYDLEKDPYELNNLVEDAKQRKLVAHLDAEIERTMRETGDRWDELKDRPFR